MAELSCTASCCWTVLVGRPSKNSRVRTGAGPLGRKVARLCLQQYGAAKAAPIRPDDTSRSKLSNNSSSRRSSPWIKSMGSTRSPENFCTAVLTGIDAPEKMSRKNRAVLYEKDCTLGHVTCIEEETHTTGGGKDSVGCSSELCAYPTGKSCRSVTRAGDQGQCGESLCLEAGWNLPQASPFAFPTEH